MSRSRTLGWGILGTGMIARKFAVQLPQSARSRIVAVGSRTLTTATQFTDQFGGSPCGSYEKVLDETDVDAVYVALPNGLHHEWTIRALSAGKHVLCEKPLARNADESEEMFSVAARSDRLLVEAFMYRGQPAIQKSIELVRDGAIGELRLIRTNFTFCRDAVASDARYQPEMAGGSLMDVGCYCIHFARAITGSEPTACHAIAHRHPLGVDDYAAGTLDFNGHVLAAFTCGMTVLSDWRTMIGGSEGSLAIDRPWIGAETITLVRGDKTETIKLPAPMEPYALEAECFAASALDGKTPIITPDDSLGNMKVLDDLRRQIGLTC